MALRMRFFLAAPLALTGVLLAGCAAEEDVSPATPAKVSKVPPAASVQPGAAKGASVAPGHLARSDVERVLRQGPPWLLRRVLPEEVIRQGKFVGWRMLSLPEDWGIDLKQGDIVTKVNGLSIERPDDLWAAWMQMQSAVELRISCERDGKARDLVVPIDGPSSAGTLSQQVEIEPPPAPKPSRWSTVVIEGDDAIPNDTPSE